MKMLLCVWVTVVLFGLDEGVCAQARESSFMYTQTLQTMKKVMPLTNALLVREGFASAGDGGQANYKWSTITCSLNKGAGDDGLQVRSDIQPGCWLAKFTSVPTILVWGADPSGQNDSTQNIQNALSSGVSAIRIPCGNFKIKSVLIPKVGGLSVVGEGACSRLVQLPSSFPMIRWDDSRMEYPEGYIRNLLLDGSIGTADLVSTAGAGGQTIADVYINNLPIGHSGIVVSGSGGAYSHDVRIDNIQIYSRTAGFAGIRLSSTSSDDEISRVIMNGNFTTRYAIFMDVGAQTAKVSSSHLYNVSDSVLVVSGNSAGLQFENCTFDNSHNDIVEIADSRSIIFTHDFFEAIGSGHSGIRATNSRFISVFNSIFSGSGGAHSAFSEVGASDYNEVIGGSINTMNFEAPIELLGPHSGSQFIWLPHQPPP
jgi:hypothetical protein